MEVIKYVACVGQVLQVKIVPGGGCFIAMAEYQANLVCPNAVKHHLMSDSGAQTAWSNVFEAALAGDLRYSLVNVFAVPLFAGAAHKKRLVCFEMSEVIGKWCYQITV
jgi:hypothetical protein